MAMAGESGRPAHDTQRRTASAVYWTTIDNYSSRENPVALVRAGLGADRPCAGCPPLELGRYVTLQRLPKVRSRRPVTACSAWPGDSLRATSGPLPLE